MKSALSRKGTVTIATILTPLIPLVTSFFLSTKASEPASSDIILFVLLPYAILSFVTSFFSYDLFKSKATYPIITTLLFAITLIPVLKHITYSFYVLCMANLLLAFMGNVFRNMVKKAHDSTIELGMLRSFFVLLPSLINGIFAYVVLAWLGDATGLGVAAIAGLMAIIFIPVANFLYGIITFIYFRRISRGFNGLIYCLVATIAISISTPEPDYIPVYIMGFLLSCIGAGITWIIYKIRGK